MLWFTYETRYRLCLEQRPAAARRGTNNKYIKYNHCFVEVTLEQFEYHAGFEIHFNLCCTYLQEEQDLQQPLIQRVRL